MLPAIPPPASEPPCGVEALAVYGRAVEIGVLPLTYAADLLAQIPFYVHTKAAAGEPEPSAEDRAAWAAADLQRWMDILTESWWPGDDAVDEERWDLPADWRTRESIVRHLHQIGLPVPDDASTNDLEMIYLKFRIAQTEAQARLHGDAEP